MPRLFGRSPTPAPTPAPTPRQTQAPRAKLTRRTGDTNNAAMSSFSGPSGRPGPPADLHREGSLASASASAYEVLLSGPDRSSLCDSTGGGSMARGSQPQQQQQHYYTVRSQHNLHRAWLAAADARRPSWSGERPPPRKLVKDPSGSARPSASREILDESDLRRKTPAGNDKNAAAGPGTLGIRRKMARWRDLRW